MILEGPQGALKSTAWTPPSSPKPANRGISRMVPGGERDRLVHVEIRDVPPLVNRKCIAAMNRMALLRAEQVFSAVPDFCWLDENDTYQTDWTRFAKDKFLTDDTKSVVPDSKKSEKL
jgi:hypothetical protein